jgi:hypothetical protein
MDRAARTKLTQKPETDYDRDCTVVTDIGFRFLHFGGSERTAA